MSILDPEPKNINPKFAPGIKSRHTGQPPLSEPRRSRVHTINFLQLPPQLLEAVGAPVIHKLRINPRVRGDSPASVDAGGAGTPPVGEPA